MDRHINQEVKIPVGNTVLKGELVLPPGTKAIVIFSHGSGSSRFSKRNQVVAKYLQGKGFGTLLFDLLTEQEDLQYINRFNIELLSKRLIGATEWVEKVTANECRISYFGASTGAASALKAAAVLPQILSVVSRGGRPDLAMADLPKVKAPTLLIVGSLDYDVLQLNKEAFMKLECEKKLEEVKGATHLFEEPGKMEIVSELAGNWFKKHLIPVSIRK